MLLPTIALLAFQAQNVPLTGSIILPKSAHAGATVKAQVKLHFADGLHGYQNPPSDEFEIPVKVSISGAKIVTVSYPKGVSMKMGNTPPVKVYSGDITVNVTFKAPKKSGPVVFKVSYQQCNESACFPPADLTLKSALAVSKK